MSRALDYLQTALNHPARLAVSPEKTLAFSSLVAREELGRPFEFEVEVISANHNVTLHEVVGKPMCVELDTTVPGKPRYFHGIVARFAHVGERGTYALYRATLRPWFWLLTRTSNCRAFYNGDEGLTIPKLVTDLFREYQFTDFADGALSRTYRTWDFLVQYRESAFNFVSRLLEQEGIYYFFTHEKGKHTLVLADSIGAHVAVDGYASVPYYPPTDRKQRERDHIDSWQLSQEFELGAYTLNDYDFLNPDGKLVAPLSAPPLHARNDFEHYDYPGEYEKSEDGEIYTRLRLQEAQALHLPVQGRGDARGLGVGCLFQLSGHLRAKDPDGKDKQFLIVSATHKVEGPDYESLTGAPAAPIYHGEFTAIESKHPFRPARTTLRPVVYGPQTAKVVGPDSEEIWTDQHGRVKVQFHWDRLGKEDENSSCWLRVSQAWAGAGWGAMHIPRIGQEVVVEFLEGDPDRPIITGRVYNGLNAPPYELPANKTQSGLKSRSTPKGGAKNFNEIRFEDKKGEEELFVHAERNHTVTVKMDRSVTVGGSETNAVTGKRKSTVSKTDELTITEKHTGHYDGGREETVKQIDKTTVEGANKETIVHGQYDITADTHFKVMQKDDVLLIENKITAASKGPVHIDNEKCKIDLKDGKVTVDGADEILIKCGEASIKLTSGGDVIINGKKVTAAGSGSSMNLAQAGAEITGPTVKLNG